MFVCIHGNVTNYCSKHGMVIVERYSGDILDYNGVCKVLVTDREMTEDEYFYLKGRMLARGYELVSVKHKDTSFAAKLLTYHARKENENGKKTGGRCRFGYQWVKGEIVPHEGMMAVVNRILELKDKGYKLRAIQDDEGVHHVDGRKLSMSTIQLIIKNREDYD